MGSDDTWSVRCDDAVGRVWVTFYGHLDASQGEASAAELRAVLQRASVELVLDIRSMKGYASDARTAWQSVLRPLRHHIRALVLIGGNPVVRMGGQILGFALGIPVRTYDRPEHVTRNG